MKMPLDSDCIKEIVASATDSESGLLYLFANMQNPESEKSVIIAVNNLLANGKTRLKGLQLLKDLLLYCSHEVFVENALQWASYCMVQHVEDGSKEIKLNTLAKIIENSNDIETFNKKFATEYLSTTLKACLVTHNNDEKLSCLKCLAQCMKRFPTWFGNHKQKVEAFLIENLDNSCEELTKWAATAFVYFLETGGAGVNGINYINNFELQFRKICATIQFLYDTFLENVPEINNTLKIEAEIFKFKEFSDPNKIFEITGTRITNCLIFLQTLLAKQYSVEKRIVPKFVVDIICRGLSVHLCFSRVITDEEINKLISLRNIQLHLLKLLRIFTTGFQPSLLPFAYELKKSLASVAKRTDVCNCFTYDTIFKTELYKALHIWLMLSKNVNETYLEEIVVPMAIKDISPVRKNVLLNLDVSKKGKSANQKEVKDSVQNKKILANNESFHRGNDCINALEMLKCLLKGSCLSYNQTLLQEIVSTLVGIVSNLQINKVVLPYSDPKCQVKLYEVLIAIFSQENVHSLSSLHSFVIIFTNGARSSNHRISQMSREGLDLLEKISQPVCASLYVCEAKSSQQITYFDSLGSEMDVAIDKDDNVTSEVSQENQAEENGTEEKKIHIISDIVIPPQPEFAKANEEIVFVDEMEMEVVESNGVDENLAEVRSSVSSSCDIVMEENTKKFSIEVKDDNEDDLEDMFSSFQDVVQE
ncbi:Proline-, glutamic acid- and leucine-rich protein 1-like Protein [Tribolium castaneum]|uniref:Proline-, glutamic acid-and leucine-rich protein 1-like Protein n=1 Tax=Tribolium castaneum TaxID=7070 RepID=D6WHK4_TRICA|nr:PREDICTED: uncharacterized protein LOC103312495 [Tribolium castaneum]XP_015834093.1 PREDICTED: uncharacterized protein LOC103312495 [Tribolium castaneum]EFA01004.2 Proline-, glutamic acid- and leucine-rich protein 1-like Protein [Tribolium castaneum]|eukprot:XP_008191456.1 PREDICTED: uncharacterized protein LOC103312495 [Tribolium castaneum]